MTKKGNARHVERQYVAVPSGLGIIEEVQGKLTPEIFTPESGNALYVFALPD